MIFEKTLTWQKKCRNILKEQKSSKKEVGMKKVFASALVVVFLLGIVVSFEAGLFAVDPNPYTYDECIEHCASWANGNQDKWERCLRAYCDRLM